MTKSPLSEILRPKDLLNPHLVASVAGRVGSRVELGSFTAKTLDRAVGKLALSSFDATRIPNDTNMYDETCLWHGTGRFKHEDGDVTDILAKIADDGYIAPRLDRFDFNGPMESVSLARSRMYARAYADMYGAEPDKSERYGDALFWACAFLGSIAVEASKELKVWTPKGYYEMMHHLGRAGVSEWYKKVTSSHDVNIVNVYRGASDIDDNYPVLFGVRGVDGIPTSRTVALHEIRTDNPLHLDVDITHVEVPNCRIEETQKILAGVAIRSIEEGETFSSQFTFTQHMHELV
jgi:hypothetical protein